MDLKCENVASKVIDTIRERFNDNHIQRLVRLNDEVNFYAYSGKNIESGSDLILEAENLLKYYSSLGDKK